MALNNTYGVHYDSARIVRILTIFEPVELIEQEFDFDFPDTDDADTIPDPDANQQVVDDDPDAIPELYRTPTYHQVNPDYGPLVRATREINGLPLK